MSILPEMIIQQTLIRGVRLFREDDRLIGMLFRNVDQRELESIRDFLHNDSIEICINYPDQDLKVPSIVILLKNETESQPFLGDLQEDHQSVKLSGVNPFPDDSELVGAQTLAGSGSVGPVAYNLPLLIQPTRAIGGTLLSVTGPDDLTSLLDPFEMDSWVVLMEGTGAGQRRKVDSITPAFQPGQGVTFEIDPTEPFTVAPDATTVFKVVGDPDMVGVTGEPAKLYKSSDNVERLGSIYRATYQLDIHGPNPEAVIYLYNIVKAIFFAANGLMIRQGFLTFLRISGTDLMPIPDYYPSSICRRSLSVEFEYAFDVYREVSEPLASIIKVALSVHSPDVGNVADTEREVSSTTIEVP